MSDIAKLQEILEQPLDEEARVLQFLVEVRKATEKIRGANNARFAVLNFFCDWVVHGTLDRSAARKILKGLDAVITHIKRHGGATRDEYDKVKGLLSFRTLQNDLAVFLTEYELDAELVGDSEKWRSFFSSYLDLIERTPLVDEKHKLNLAHINRIEVSKSHSTLGPPVSADERFMFRIVWQFQKDGVRTGSISNEVWFPKVAQQIQVPVLNRQSKPDGSIGLVGLEAREFISHR